MQHHPFYWKCFPNRFKWNYVEHIQWWRWWWYQKGGCSAGRFHGLNMIVLVCACASVCMCVAVTFFYYCVAFNSIIQWCISQIYGTNTHTCACIHIHWDTHTHTVINVHPGRNIFICAAASMTIIACFCCIIITRVLWKIMWSQKKSTQFMPLNMICQL